MKCFVLSRVVGLAFVALLLTGPSHAGGLYLSSFGDPSTGTASAGANAIAEDASTAHTNPAGMTRLDDHQILGGLAPGFTNIEFKADQQTSRYCPAVVMVVTRAVSSRFRLPAMSTSSPIAGASV